MRTTRCQACARRVSLQPDRGSRGEADDLKDAQQQQQQQQQQQRQQAAGECGHAASSADGGQRGRVSASPRGCIPRCPRLPSTPSRHPPHRRCRISRSRGIPSLTCTSRISAAYQARIPATSSRRLPPPPQPPLHSALAPAAAAAASPVTTCTAASPCFGCCSRACRQLTSDAGGEEGGQQGGGPARCSRIAPRVVHVQPRLSRISAAAVSVVSPPAAALALRRCRLWSRLPAQHYLVVEPPLRHQLSFLLRPPRSSSADRPPPPLAVARARLVTRRVRAAGLPAACLLFLVLAVARHRLPWQAFPSSRSPPAAALVAGGQLAWYVGLLYHSALLLLSLSLLPVPLYLFLLDALGNAQLLLLQEAVQTRTEQGFGPSSVLGADGDGAREKARIERERRGRQRRRSDSLSSLSSASSLSSEDADDLNDERGDIDDHATFSFIDSLPLPAAAVLRRAAGICAGREPYITRTVNPLLTLGTVTTFCCLDSEGILSENEPSPDHLLLFSAQGKPQVLDIINDPLSPNGISMEGEWRRCLPALKPIGLTCALCHQCNMREEQLCEYAWAGGEGGAEGEEREVSGCLCPLAREIGFDVKWIRQQYFISKASYRQRSTQPGLSAPPSAHRLCAASAASGAVQRHADGADGALHGQAEEEGQRQRQGAQGQDSQRRRCRPVLLLLLLLLLPLVRACRHPQHDVGQRAGPAAARLLPPAEYGRPAPGVPSLLGLLGRLGHRRHRRGAGVQLPQHRAAVAAPGPALHRLRLHAPCPPLTTACCWRTAGSGNTSSTAGARRQDGRGEGGEQRQRQQQEEQERREEEGGVAERQQTVEREEERSCRREVEGGRLTTGAGVRRALRWASGRLGWLLLLRASTTARKSCWRRPRTWCRTREAAGCAGTASAAGRRRTRAQRRRRTPCAPPLTPRSSTGPGSSSSRTASPPPLPAA